MNWGRPRAFLQILDLDVLLKHIQKADDDNGYVGNLKGSFNGNSSDLVKSKFKSP